VFLRAVRAALANWVNKQGRFLLYGGDLRRAEGCFRCALRLDPDSTLAKYNLAIVEYRKGNLDESRRRFQAIIDSSPPPSYRADSLIRLGNILDEQGDREGAFACYADVLSIVIDDTHADEKARLQGDAFCGMGYVEHERGNIDRAIQLYNEALEYDPLCVASLANLTQCYARQGRFREAIAVCRRSLELEPGRGDGWLDLGDLYMETGDSEEAYRCYLRAWSLGEGQAEDRIASLNAGGQGT
jgi:tetratricopeptide (TPR) repeat protein